MGEFNPGVLHDLLANHQPVDGMICTCGKADPAHDYPRHVVAVYEQVLKLIAPTRRCH